MYDNQFRGPFEVWILDYFTKEPKAANLFSLGGAWFEHSPASNTYEHFVYAVFMCEQNALEAAIAINKVKMDNEIKAKQENIRNLSSKLEVLNALQ